MVMESAHPPPLSQPQNTLKWSKRSVDGKTVHKLYYLAVINSHSSVTFSLGSECLLKEQTHKLPYSQDQLVLQHWLQQ